MGADSENHYSKSMPRAVDFSPVWQAWDLIEKEFRDPTVLDRDKMIAGMIKGLLDGTGDTHCHFFAKNEFEKFLSARVDGSVSAEVFRIKRRHGRTFNIGYLKIKGFYEKTHEEVIEASVEFKKNNVRGIVLDLRRNTGGRLYSARGVAGAFLGPDKLLLTKAGRKGTFKMFSFGEHVFKGIPTVCLIDHYSASASEALAGALRDHLGTKLIGVKSYGKGSIQENKEIEAGVILITTYYWTTPKGHTINGKGLEPDIKVSGYNSIKTKYKDDAPLDIGIRELLDE